MTLFYAGDVVILSHDTPKICSNLDPESDGQFALDLDPLNSLYSDDEIKTLVSARNLIVTNEDGDGLGNVPVRPVGTDDDPSVTTLWVYYRHLDLVERPANALVPVENVTN